MMLLMLLLQGKLWDWDSAEADMMLLQGSDNLPPGGPPILTGGAGGGGGGQMSQGGDDNLDYDPQDGMRAQSANAKRAVTANTTAARPGTALGSWGFGDSKAVSGQVAEDQAAYDAKAAAATSRSAGSLHRDREEVGADGQPRRPHTAHGGRVDQSEEVGVTLGLVPRWWSYCVFAVGGQRARGGGCERYDAVPASQDRSVRPRPPPASCPSADDCGI
jgi:hypothetical protein